MIISGPPQMAGPKYQNIDESHKYGPVNPRVKGEMVTAAPVYGVDPHNTYSEVPVRIPGGEIMAGPVYHGIDPKNQFVPPTSKVDGPLVMAGPIYKGVGTKHSCHVVPDKADNPTLVLGPVLPAGRQHKYNPFEPKKELESGLQGPIFNV